jgi:transcription-repair coupling factor (superfamily II helicase)
MEIRGAGNLLGAQQHGQIEMVGFDLYLKLLEEAVRELRGEPAEDDLDPVVTIDAAAYLPEEYVAEAAQRLALYKRLAGVRSPAEIEDARRELRDRFGPLPDAAARLLDVVALRLAAQALRLERLEVRAGHALLTFAARTPVPPERVVELLRRHGRRLRTVRESVFEATIPRGPWPETLRALTQLLAEFRGPTEARR